MIEPVDFHHVPERQREIDAKLVNWARWCRTGGGGSQVLPMFRGYRDNYFELPGAAMEPINVPQAVEVQKVMARVPEKNRIAVQWCYIIKSNPVRIARGLAVSREGLLLLITDGRDMVKNRLTVDKPMCILPVNVSLFA